MKTVALHPGAADLHGQRNQLGNGRLPAMKARVEAGNLRHIGEQRGYRVDRGEVVRLVERSQGLQLSQMSPEHPV